MKAVSLSMTEGHFDVLNNFLFPGDGKEAAAILLCGRSVGDRCHRLLVREIHFVPYASCTIRAADQLKWPTDAIVDYLDKAEENGWSVVKIHSHPNGYPKFSGIDDISDRELLPSIKSWVEKDIPHGSVIMLPDGKMVGRVMDKEGAFVPMLWVNVVGEDLRFWYTDEVGKKESSFAASHAQVLGRGTMEMLKRLSVAVIGCSGTGSPVIEQLFRLGVGELVLVDDDKVEERNVNRILNSKMSDAGAYKVDVLAAAIERTGIGTEVRVVKKNLWDPEAIKEVAQCDIVFGCVDSLDGRFILNAIATNYIQAYFDLGVRIDTYRTAERKGEIREVCGTVHYLQPGQSSLMSRGLFSIDQANAAALARLDPIAHAEQVKDGYIAGVDEQQPAVIMLNMNIATWAINEMLSRLHPYRQGPNGEFASVTISLTGMDIITEPESAYKRCTYLSTDVGLGDRIPLLGLPQLS